MVRRLTPSSAFPAAPFSSAGFAAILIDDSRQKAAYGVPREVVTSSMPRCTSRRCTGFNCRSHGCGAARHGMGVNTLPVATKPAMVTTCKGDAATFWPMPSDQPSYGTHGDLFTGVGTAPRASGMSGATKRPKPKRPYHFAIFSAA